MIQGQNANNLVSIITPAYNCECFIEDMFRSVQRQTYTNWELLITEDHSQDGTWERLCRFAEEEPRLKLFRTKCNCGAANARNVSISHAKGRYIAYLDADDMWIPNKLEKQICFMQHNSVPMCYAGIETVDKNGGHINYVHVPLKMGYKDFLANTLTASPVMVIDTELVDRDLLPMRPLPREDLCAWLRILKTGITAYGIDEPLAKYRKHEDSSSANLVKMAGQTWYVYRKVEKLGFFFSLLCFVGYAYHAVRKRMREN